MRKIVKNTKQPVAKPEPKNYVIDSRGVVHFYNNNTSRIRMMRDLEDR